MISLTTTTDEPSVDAPPPPVPVRESGYANDLDTGWWTDLTREETPELAWPDSVRVFDRMRRQDAQVSSVLRAVNSPILRTGWSVDPAGASDEITEFVASNLGLPIKGTDSAESNTALLRGRDRFSWNEHTRLALTCLPFGHSYFEQQYRYDAAGRARIRKLAFRPQRTIGQVNVARDGGLVAIQQWPAGTLGAIGGGSFFEKPIPVSRLVAYVLEREGGNWLGISMLRAAYKNWLLKDRALRTWSISIDRNGVGVPIYIGAENETDLSAGKNLARSIRSGDNSGGGIPYGAQLPIKGVEGSTADIAAFVRYQDEQIARAVLAHFLNLGSQTGSWALGTTFADFFTLSLQAIAEEYRDVTTSHIVEDLVDINFGRGVPAPQIHFDEIGSRGGLDDELTAVRKAAGLENDDDLAAFLRTNTNVPEVAA